MKHTLFDACGAWVRSIAQKLICGCWQGGHRVWWALSPKLALPLPTIVVGNVVIGGVGKTPLVQWLAQCLDESGHSPHVLTLGWGGKNHGGFLRDYFLNPVTRVRSSHTPVDVGDEALEIATQVTAPVWCGARCGMINAAHGAGAGCLIVDDGLQHPLLARAFHVLVVDAQTPLTDPIVPYGPYREPLKDALQRVSAVVVMLSPSLSVVPEDLTDLLGAHPCVPVVVARVVSTPPVGISPLVGASRYEVIEKNARIFAFCGIGRPEKFFSSLVAQGYTLTCTKAFPDHHVYTHNDIASLLKEVASYGEGEASLSLVTTRKDAVKLQHFPDIAGKIAVSKASLSWDHGHDAVFLSLIDAYQSQYASL